MSEAIHGVTMETLAEVMSKHGEFSAKFGERDYKPHFLQYLQGKGLNENVWAHAHNGWMERFRADPTGQLQAKFHMMEGKLSRQAHMGDVPDASQDAQNGVTLEKYAEIMALQAANKDGEAAGIAIIQKHGFSMDQWQKANAGWQKVMAADTTFRITTQYGELYAKYTPGFEQNMQDQTAALLAQANAQHANQDSMPDEPEEDYTTELAMADAQSNIPKKRRLGAYHLANDYDLDNSLTHVLPVIIPIFIDCLESHDENSASDAEGAGRQLLMLAGAGALTSEQADDAEGAMARCLGRAQEKLGTLKAAFAPIQDKNVPERVFMQAKIQDYTSLVEELTEFQSEWQSELASGRENASSSSSSSSSSASAPSRSGGGAIAPSGSDGGLMAILKQLPIIGNILRMLGL